MIDLFRSPHTGIGHYSVLPFFSFGYMRSWSCVLLLCFSLSLCKYSYSDKCYRFEKVYDDQCIMSSFDFKVDTFYYQSYFNSKGKPLSNDYIAYEKSSNADRVLTFSFYYQ